MEQLDAIQVMVVRTALVHIQLRAILKLSVDKLSLIGETRSDVMASTALSVGAKLPERSGGADSFSLGQYNC